MISLFVIVADFFIACFEVSISFYRRINELLNQLFIAFLSKGWVSQFLFDDALLCLKGGFWEWSADFCDDFIKRKTISLHFAISASGAAFQFERVFEKLFRIAIVTDTVFHKVGNILILIDKGSFYQEFHCIA